MFEGVPGAFNDHPGAFKDRSAAFTDRSATLTDRSAAFKDRSAAFKDRSVAFKDRSATLTDRSVAFKDRARTAPNRVFSSETPFFGPGLPLVGSPARPGGPGRRKILKKIASVVKSPRRCVDDTGRPRVGGSVCCGAAGHANLILESAMGTVPQSYIGKIEFFEAHLPIWSTDPAAIGLDAAQVATLATYTANARTEYDNLVAVRANARAATNTQKDTNDIMYNFGADLIKTIRAFAQTTNNDAVYNDAAIPPPSPPTPLGPPATPKNVNAQLNTAGEIVLTWDATREGGTSFIIERSTASATGPWTMIGSVEAVDFTDTAVPTGLNSVSYRITANRSAGSSTPTAAVTVPFGNTGSSNSSNSTAGGEDLTLAA